MDSLVGFYIYAATFRLAIIAAGIVSIVLGYKLFVHDTGSESRTDVGAQADRFKIIIRNAAPGTVFAAFGAIIIAVMLFQGNPEYEEYKQLTDCEPDVSQSQPEKTEKTANRTTSRRRTRSGSGNEDVPIDQEWAKLDKPNTTLSEAAEPLSKIARIWRQEQRTGEAVAMARLAAFYGAESDKAKYLALLGETLFENGNEQKAVLAIQKAAELDPLYLSALTRMQERSEGKE